MHFLKRLLGSLTKWINRKTQNGQLSQSPSPHQPGGIGYGCVLSVTCNATDSPRLEKEIAATAKQQRLAVCDLHQLPLPDSALLQLVITIRSQSDTRSHLVKMVHAIAIDRAVRAVRWERLPHTASQNASAHIETRTHRAHLKRLTALNTAAPTRPATPRYPEASR